MTWGRPGHALVWQKGQDHARRLCVQCCEDNFASPVGGTDATLFSVQRGTPLDAGSSRPEDGARLPPRKLPCRGWGGSCAYSEGAAHTVSGSLRGGTSIQASCERQSSAEDTLMVARWEGVWGHGEKVKEIKQYKLPVVQTVMGI